MGADGMVFVQRQDQLYFRKQSACQGIEFQADIKIMMEMDYVRLCPFQYARECFDHLFRFLREDESIGSFREKESFVRPPPKRREGGSRLDSRGIVSPGQEMSGHGRPAANFVEQPIRDDLRAARAQLRVRVSDDQDGLCHTGSAPCRRLVAQPRAGGTFASGRGRSFRRALDDANVHGFQGDRRQGADGTGSPLRLGPTMPLLKKRPLIDNFVFGLQVRRHPYGKTKQR